MVCAPRELAAASGGRALARGGAAALARMGAIGDRGRGFSMGRSIQVRDFFAWERKAWAAYGPRVAGVDEVGRGPLAGPVVAAAVVLPGPVIPAGVRDSKALSAQARERLAAALRALPGIQISISSVDAGEIDRIHILRATHAAMRAALLGLDPPPDFVLVDGLPVRDLPFPSQAIVKGDAKCASIAAASIVAKVHRDRFMQEMDRRYPGYGFGRNMGYGTREHLTALKALGPCPIHRRSFAPVARALSRAPVQLELDFGDADSRPRGSKKSFGGGEA